VEHTHTQECYINDVLLCRQKAHIHSEDCYLLHLEDNDINWLLMTVDKSEGKSLESVLDSALAQTLVLNENLRFVEYQPNGMTSNILRQFRNSPRSFVETRKLYLSFPNTGWKFRFRHSMHYVSSCIFAKNKHFLKESPAKGWTLAALLPGLALNLYIRLKTRR
jgi:hypothetical protein